MIKKEEQNMKKHTLESPSLLVKGNFPHVDLNLHVSDVVFYVVWHDYTNQR